MKILRSVNRRGSSIETAGYFTVLKAGNWFPATRLPKGLRQISVKSDLTSGADQPGRDAAVLARAMSIEDREIRPARFALIVISAATITYALLWWTSVPR